MTQGIYINNWILLAQFIQNRYINFGPGGTAYAIYAAGNQNDVSETLSFFQTDDGYASAFLALREFLGVG